MTEQTDAAEVARREVEDLWWLRHCLESLIANKDTNSTIRVGLLRGVLETTRPETSTTDPARVLREQIAVAIEAEADRAHAAFASDEDAHLADMRNRLGVTLEPGHWNRHDDGCSMCGMAGAARIVRAAQVAPSRAPEEES